MCVWMDYLVVIINDIFKSMDVVDDILLHLKFIGIQVNYFSVDGDEIKLVIYDL